MVLDWLRARDEWKFFGVLPKADSTMAFVWWALLLLRGVLPALFAIAMGVLIGAVQRGESLTTPLSIVGVVFVLLQTTSPLHQSIGKNLGSRTASWLYDELTRTCVRPPGMGHLEDPRLTTDLTIARDFDLGISGPPLSISMDFIGSGLVELIAGLHRRAGARRVRMVGAACSWAARGSPRNGCCAKARSGATATLTRYVRRSATPTTRTGSR